MNKLVNVYCMRPFSIGYSSFAGVCKRIALDTDGIRICLENKARVEEVLKNGKLVPLSFANFEKYNGEPAIDVESAITMDDALNYKEPVVETITPKKPLKAENSNEKKSEEVKKEDNQRQVQSTKVDVDASAVVLQETKYQDNKKNDKYNKSKA